MIRYAANSIVFPPGDWYGSLNKLEDARALLQVINGAVDQRDNDVPTSVRHLWRGRMGLDNEENQRLVRLCKAPTP